MKMDIYHSQSIVRSFRGLQYYEWYFGSDIAEPKGILIDIGAGDSTFAKEVAQDPALKSRIIRVDPDYKYAEPEYKNDIVIADAEKLPFKNDYADDIVSSWVLIHFTRAKTAKVLHELLRVAKPGSRIMIYPALPLKKMPSGARKERYTRTAVSRTLVITKPSDFNSWSSDDRNRLIKSLTKSISFSDRLFKIGRTYMAKRIKRAGTNRTMINGVNTWRRIFSLKD